MGALIGVRAGRRSGPRPATILTAMLVIGAWATAGSAGAHAGEVTADETAAWGTVSQVGKQATFIAGQSAINDLKVVKRLSDAYDEGAELSQYWFDDIVPIVAGEGCTTSATDPTVAWCDQVFTFEPYASATIVLGDRNDRVDTGRATKVFGGTGDDVITSRSHTRNTAYGGPGDDVLKDVWVCRGDSGDDRLTGCRTASGGSGADLIRGTSDADLLGGGSGEDVIWGQGGDDRIGGGPGADTLFGNRGNDTIHGDQGDDTLFGNEGNDTISGGSGRDWILGGPGRDRSSGGPGDDTIKP